MAFKVEDFVNDILKDVNVDDTQKQNLLAVINNPTIAKRLEDSTLRQSDYSKKQAELKDKLDKAQNYWDGLVQWKSERETELATKEKRLNQKLVDEGIDLGDGQGKPAANGVSKEELQELANQSVAYQNAVAKISVRHLKDFNDVLDMDEVLKIAASQKVNINQAYDFYTQPKRDEIRKNEFEEALKKAREEGAAEALKNHSMPIAETQTFNTNGVHALDRLDKPAKDQQASEFGVAAAVRQYQEDRRKGVQHGIV